MSFQRSFVMGLVVFATLALSGQMTRALARGGDGSGGRSVKMTSADEAQMRELLAKLAAASGQAAPEERTDADLMYEAMIRWNGEPAGSAAIERLLEQSKKESTRTKKATVEKVRKMFWKDPFSDHPTKLIPVRQEDRELLATFDRKGQRRGGAGATRESRDSELARLRAEIEAARAETDAVRAENARLRERAEEMSVDRRECVADNDGRAEVRMRRRASSGSGRSHRHEARQTQIAAAPAGQGEAQTSEAPPPVEPVMTTTVPPPAHGMIITPLPITPPPAPPATEQGRRSRASRSAAR